MVAIEGSVTPSGDKGLPLVDTTNILVWAKQLRMWLMRLKQNHLGLLIKPRQLADTPSQWRKKVELWEERNATCMSVIYEACGGNPDALEIADQYMLEKDMLADNAVDKNPVAIELMKRVTDRFKDDAQDELGELNREFTSFEMADGEKVCTGIDRLNGVIQKLTQHGQAPTPEAKLSKLEDALNISSLSDLWLSVALKDNLTYDTLVLSCKKYDKALEKKTKKNGENAVLWTGEKTAKEIVCSYPSCGKPGHSSKDCYTKKADQKAGKLKTN